MSRARELLSQLGNVSEKMFKKLSDLPDKVEGKWKLVDPPNGFEDNKGDKVELFLDMDGEDQLHMNLSGRQISFEGSDLKGISLDGKSLKIMQKDGHDWGFEK